MAAAVGEKVRMSIGAGSGTVFAIENLSEP
jgi:hypothetical protein